MSASKITHEFRTVLDVNSKCKLSKHKVVRLLRNIDVLITEEVGSKAIYIDNEISIGMYTIRLLLNRSGVKCSNPHRLKDYGGFNIRIYENKKEGLVEIDINKHILFSDLDWVQRNEADSLRISDLTSAIIFCNRLDRLKAFN